MARPTVAELGDLAVAALICGFAAYYWVETSDLAPLDVRFSQIVIVLIALLGAQTVLEVVRQVWLRSSEPPPLRDQLSDMVSARSVVMVVLTVCFAIAVQRVDFYLASFAFVVAVGAVAFGVRRPAILVVDGLLVVVAVNLLFEQALGVRFT